MSKIVIRDDEAIEAMEPILKQFRFDEILNALVDKAYFEVDNSLDKCRKKHYGKLGAKLEKLREWSFAHRNSME